MLKALRRKRRKRETLVARVEKAAARLERRRFKLHELEMRIADLERRAVDTHGIGLGLPVEPTPRSAVPTGEPASHTNGSAQVTVAGPGYIGD